MKWITHHGCTQENQSPGPTVVALGCFDGLHIAHKAIVSRAVLAAREHGGIPTIFTFDASSSVGGKQTPLLMDNASRFRRMREWGIEQIYYPPFSAVRDIPAEAFVREVLAGCCRAKMALCGFNFHFGKAGRPMPGNCSGWVRSRGSRWRLSRRFCRGDRQSAQPGCAAVYRRAAWKKLPLCWGTHFRWYFPWNTAGSWAAGWDSHSKPNHPGVVYPAEIRGICIADAAGWALVLRDHQCGGETHRGFRSSGSGNLVPRRADRCVWEIP